MTFSAYLKLVFAVMGRRITGTKNGRILFITMGFLLGFIGVSAVFVPPQAQLTEQPLNIETTTDAFIVRAEEALSDMDPVTLDILRTAVKNIATSADPVKRDAFRTFAESDRPAAIEMLEIHARKQTDAGKAGNAVRTLKEIGALSFLVDPDASMRAYEAALALAPKDAAIRNQLGHLYNQAGRGQDASEQFRSILDDRKLIGTPWEASALANLGVLAMQSGDIQQAEYYTIRSLQLNEKLNRRKAIGLQHANLGLIAISLGKEGAVESNFTKALTIFEELGEKRNSAALLSNFGMFESVKKNQDTAFEYLSRSHKIYDELGQKDGVALQMSSLARVERLRGNRDEAENWYKQSAALYLELGRLQEVGAKYAMLGGIEMERNNIAGACEYWREAQSLFSKTAADSSLNQLQYWMDAAKCAQTG